MGGQGCLGMRDARIYTCTHIRTHTHIHTYTHGQVGGNVRITHAEAIDMLRGLAEDDPSVRNEV
jgi:hypothetical protein